MLIIGGVEINPGPDKPGTTTRQSTLTKTGAIAPIEPDVDMKQMFANLSKQITENSERIRSDFQSLKEEISASQSRIEGKMCELEMENQKLLGKVRQLEDQNRRNNLVFWGVEEANEFESWDECERKVRDIISEKMSVEDAHDDNTIQIERAHRLGRKTANSTQNPKPRGIIVNFGRWKHKQQVLKAARAELPKGSIVKVSEDFSQAVRDMRRGLIENIDRLKDEFPNEKVFLRFDKLVVGSKTFRFDVAKKKMYQDS